MCRYWFMISERKNPVQYKTIISNILKGLQCKIKGTEQITHRNQSTAMMRLMSSVGRPTEVSTMTMVTSPAWGIPAAPILAAVAVMLHKQTKIGFIAWDN